MSEIGRRDIFFDVVKAIAIVLVVVNHVFPKSQEAFPIWIGNFIVAVNMPLFFIVSGYFCWKTIETCDHLRLVRHIKSYLLPAVWIAVLTSAVSYYLDGMTVKAFVVPYKALKLFVFGPWFVWSLANCYLMAFGAGMIYRCVKGRANLWILLALAEIILLFMPECMGIVYKVYTREMFVYFVIGGALWRSGRKLWENKWGGMVALLGLIVYSTLVSRPCREIGMSFYFNETSWRAFLHWQTALLMFARLALGCMGTIGMMWAVHNLCRLQFVRQGLLLSLIAKMGGCTLGIYLLHQWLLARVVACCPMSISSRWAAIALTLLLIAVCYGVTYFTQERSTFLRKWMWGK